ncbi:MAG: MBL fold metallo-hydrolase, partial [Salinisphaeraceae bacterium]|nr:MBL fold metallo-hydrolase [Salinisphaeraceae bacterium]
MEKTTQQAETINGLTYPLGQGFIPEPGKTHEIAPGVHWLHMPLPYSLDRINLWLLEDGDGWTVVDTGLDLPASREIWEQLFTGLMGGRPIKRVIVTHLHPDHVGLAGWLCERFDCELWMSREEFLMCRNLVADTGKPAPQLALDFYQQAGFDDEQLETYRRRFGEFGE